MKLSIHQKCISTLVFTAAISALALTGFTGLAAADKATVKTDGLYWKKLSKADLRHPALKVMLTQPRPCRVRRQVGGGSIANRYLRYGIVSRDGKTCNIYAEINPKGGNYQDINDSVKFGSKEHWEVALGNVSAI